jgi:hypothetical protein
LVQRSTNRKILLVEGKDDQHSVVHLMRAHVRWPDDRTQAPVDIQDGGGKDAVLEEGRIVGLVKERGMRAVGVMLDADDDCAACYRRIRDRCLAIVPAMPMEQPSDGLIVSSEGFARLGVWIMPDNTSRGDLETFLRNLVPDHSKALWQLAGEATASAKERGARSKRRTVPRRSCIPG